MKIAMLMAVVALMVSANGYAAKTSSDEGAIRELANNFTTAWNKHDPKALAGFWADDGSAINPVGRQAWGKAEIEKLFSDEHTTNMKATTATMNVDKVRFLKPDVAFVDVSMEITGMTDPAGKTMPVSKLHVALVQVKKAKKWWFVDARPYAFLPPPPREGASAQQ